MPEILVVDDDATARAHLRRLLTAAGYAVTEAPSGADALAYLVDHAPAAVVLDLVMPAVSGLETLRVLRAGGRRTPVVMVSGAGALGAAGQARRAGADAYLAKRDLADPTHGLAATVRALIAA